MHLMFEIISRIKSTCGLGITKDYHQVKRITRLKWWYGNKLDARLQAPYLSFQAHSLTHSLTLPLSCDTTLLKTCASGYLSQLATGCVTCHTSHGCVTHFRPILGNLVEVTLVTSPFMYIVSHAKGTSFP